MSDNHETTHEIMQLFAEQLHIEIPAADTDLVQAGMIDSLTLVELLVQLEQRFNTTVATEDLDLDNFRTAERIAAFVHRNGKP